VKQVTQRLRDGRVEVLEVPVPALRPDGVLVDVRASVLSPGTERAKVATGRQSLLGKARSRPDQVSQVLAKVKRDGIRETARTVRARLDSLESLGYSCAGVVLEVGERVADLLPGDRVACGGGGYAVHAEVAYVPANLCVRVPQRVELAEAAFTTLGSIALHGIRQAEAQVGERVTVIGLGLIGQLAGQILRAAGCKVVGVDLSEQAVGRALAAGAVDVGFVRSALDASALPAEATECDVVLIAAASKSSDPIQLAARLCRDRGRVVVIGDVGMNISRADYYEKEIELKVARSYGPGRYDSEYEERGLDYPIGYVRWTERRNMEAFLELIAAGKVDVLALVSARLAVDRAAEAYERLVAGDGSPLAMLLEYEPSPKPPAREGRAVRPRTEGTHRVGVVGAGSFAQRILIPSLMEAGFTLETISSATGLSARTAADRFGFGRVEEPEVVLSAPDVDLVVVATRHSSHSQLAAAGLRGGKDVYVEKPPCLSESELDELRNARAESARLLFVGFNRRHAPLAGRLRDHVRETGLPFDLVYRVNAAPLPPDHWLNDPEEGGGRLVGEGCHFVDFACWLAGALPRRVVCLARPEPGKPIAAAQSFTIALDFPDGSLATIVYESTGATGLAKELVEVHSGGRSGVLEDFRSLTLHGAGRRRVERSRSADKGHTDQIRAVRDVLAGASAVSDPDPLDTMATTFAALRSASGAAREAL
jgi:predicted dehydrogenase/threonine dehydrogenase-like Zn-dependent dehydrogenase